MWDNKLKAVTFSFDDAVIQDKKAIEILDKYNLKATFNLNSALLGCKGKLNLCNDWICHDKISVSEVKKIYKNHEVAVHTLSHPNLTELDESSIVYQVEEDRVQLEKLTGKKVYGMAYPCGGVNNDDRVAKILKNNTSILYSRTITSTHSFELQENLFRFNPTVYFIEDCLFELGKKFIECNPHKPQLFYIWGHTYELDSKLFSWEKFEMFCSMISNQNDIFYGTNSEVLLVQNVN